MSVASIRRQSAPHVASAGAAAARTASAGTAAARTGGPTRPGDTRPGETRLGDARLLGPLPATPSPVPLRRLPLPVREPLPATSAVMTMGGSCGAAGSEQEALDLAGPDGAPTLGPLAAADGRGPAVGAVLPPLGPHPAAAATVGGNGPETRTPGMPAERLDVQRWVMRFVQAAAEAVTAVRPAGQLVRWTTSDVQAVIERRAELARRWARGPAGGGRGPIVVRSVVCCPVREGVYEASAVVQWHDRFRAVALRAERLDDRWRATVLELG